MAISTQKIVKSKKAMSLATTKNKLHLRIWMVVQTLVGKIPASLY
jgi:hypothetical protein